MIGCGFEVTGAQFPEEGFGQLGPELLSPVSDDVQRDPIPTEPLFEQRLCYGVGLLVLQGPEFQVFGEGIRDEEDVLLLAAQCEQGSEEVGENLLVRFCRLWQ